MAVLQTSNTTASESVICVYLHALNSVIGPLFGHVLFDNDKLGDERHEEEFDDSELAVDRLPLNSIVRSFADGHQLKVRVMNFDELVQNEWFKSWPA